MEQILLGKIPKEQRTYQLCLEAVSKNKMNLRHVPAKYKTKELCSQIKRFNGILKFTPHDIKTYEICINAVKRRCYELKYVPRKFKTVELCLTSLFCGTANFRYIPKPLLTEEFCKLAISINPYLINIIPEDKLNFHLCLCAVLRCNRLIDYIPEKFKAQWLIDIASNERNYFFSPRHYMS